MTADIHAPGRPAPPKCELCELPRPPGCGLCGVPDDGAEFDVRLPDDPQPAPDLDAGQLDEIVAALGRIGLNLTARVITSLRERVAKAETELSRWQSGELCTAKDAANTLHNLEMLGCANRRAEATEARVVELEAALPNNCDGKEQEAFEAWAKEQRYDMREHPLHYLFLDSKTYAARQGWNAAIAYCRKTALNNGGTT